MGKQECYEYLGKLPITINCVRSLDVRNKILPSFSNYYIYILTRWSVTQVDLLYEKGEVKILVGLSL